MSWFSSSEPSAPFAAHGNDSTEQVDANLPPITLTVFWCGTDGNKDLDTTQIQLFGSWCNAIDISDVTGPLVVDDNADAAMHYKLRFDGCGVAFGMMGVIFGSGLSDQASLLFDRVSEIVTRRRRKVILNMLGLSRGAVGCFIAAKKFRKFDPNFLEIHMLAFDPVPGNFVTSAKLDLFGITNAWGNMNLKSVAVLKSALLLYPYEPLPTAAVHAPMIPCFAPGIAHFDVIIGCHQGAMWNYGSLEGHTRSLDTWISATIIKNFLSSHGTILDCSQVDRYFPKNDSSLLGAINVENQKNESSERVTHSYGSIQILRVTNSPVLNKFHAILREQERLNTIGDDWSKKPFFYLTPIAEDLQLALKFSTPL